MRLPALSPPQPFTLPRPDGSVLTFRLEPLSLGFQRRLREHGLLPPFPPVRVQRDSSGKLLRDDHGQPLTTPNPQDPAYQRESELYHQRVAVPAIAEALRSDPQFALETPPPRATEDWPAYADALFDEMERAGLTAGDLVLLCDAVCRLSNLLDRPLAAAHNRFFSPAPPHETPPPS
jgi:hypothetical protein